MMQTLTADNTPAVNTPVRVRTYQGEEFTGIVVARSWNIDNTIMFMEVERKFTSGNTRRYVIWAGQDNQLFELI